MTNYTSLLTEGNPNLSLEGEQEIPMAEKIKQVQPEDLVGPLKSSSIIKRHPLNPIFTSNDVPYPSVIAYNAGVV